MARGAATVDGSIPASHAARTAVSATVTATADAARAAVGVGATDVIAMDAIATTGIMTGGRRRGIGISAHVPQSLG